MQLMVSQILNIREDNVKVGTYPIRLLVYLSLVNIEISFIQSYWAITFFALNRFHAIKTILNSETFVMVLICA
jgi:hypothetical protein